MSTTLFFDFTIDKQNNTINIKREFAADRSIVWDYYTKSELLDQWWMPSPWKSRTKSMDFREGGKWHYAAVGPNGEEHWSITSYLKIEPQHLFIANDAFGDADGNINPQMPQSKWTMNFSDMEKNTLVHGIMEFSDFAQLEQTIAMGFKDGLTMAMKNLDAILAKH
ncbi:SRPBCC family protein [Pedobacter boryungensis]|uniref:SRPBCC domain-containing protein n=1 Tax=Pedobacter boryungensis TaxID=869962 RepID=A0ABX2DBH7_9SPHI|nr:SRPBCC domain-containing protein [Pedobacter boryungensis]NQX30788.1 SRPBCC domain-containing protein [Pedobacter boryungensis]